MCRGEDDKVCGGVQGEEGEVLILTVSQEDINSIVENIHCIDLPIQACKGHIARKPSGSCVSTLGANLASGHS